MRRAAADLAAGHRPLEVPARGRDEAAQLARQFNAMATEVLQARETQRDFLANASHDLRTPLTSIQGFAQAIADGTASDLQAVKRSAEVILQESERMDRLIQGLLDLARMDSGQLVPAREPVDLAAVLARLAEKLVARASEKGIELDLAVPPDLPEATGDADWLERAFANLLDNALRHTPSGGQRGRRGERGGGTGRGGHLGYRARDPRPTSSPGSSSASTGWTNPGPREAPASGSPS